MSSCVSKRCSCFAVTTGLKCKLKTKNKYCNKYVCHVHAVILFNYSILYIQKMYIGYRTRRKLKNIFVKLPNDLQNIVLWYMREPIYIKRYYNVISKILDRKIINITISENSYDYYRKISNVYTLYTKYINITSIFNTMLLYRLQIRFLNKFRIFIQERTQVDLQLYDNVKNQLFESFKTFKNTYDIYYNLSLQEKIVLNLLNL